MSSLAETPPLSHDALDEHEHHLLTFYTYIQVMLALHTDIAEHLDAGLPIRKYASDRTEQRMRS